MSNTKQFEVFMKAHQDMVFSVAVRLLGKRSDAEDVAQTVFLKAFERFDQLETSPAAGGWLRTVTTNLCLNHLSRYRSRWRFFSELRNSDDDDDFADKLPATDTLAVTERRQFLEEGLARLPSAQRVPLVLFHFEGMSCEDIASRLGVSEGKVKTDMHRGRLALKRLLSREV